MRSNIGHVVQQLAVGVNAKRKTAHQVVFGGTQFGLGRALSHKARHHVTRQLQCSGGLVGPGLQAHGEGTSVNPRREIAVDAVGQATLFANLGRQTRHKTATAQHIVAHRQGEIIRVGTGHAGLTEQHLGLGRIKGDDLL